MKHQLDLNMHTVEPRYNSSTFKHRNRITCLNRSILLNVNIHISIHLNVRLNIVDVGFQIQYVRMDDVDRSHHPVQGTTKVG